MTTHGVDYAWERPDTGLLAAEGYAFACRYLSHDTTGKNLSPTEAENLASHGISVVSNWEFQPRHALMGYSAGVVDAGYAQTQHANCGGPADRPIYFSVDFQPGAGDWGAIFAYLDGCATVLGRQRVGVYGGYETIRQAHDAGKAAWFWQTYAWSGGRWHPAAHIRQYHNDVAFHGVALDLDDTDVADFGQWVPIGTANPPTSGEDPMLTHWTNFKQGDGTFGHPNPFALRGQALLNAAGVTDENGHPLAEDGMAGPHTDHAIRALQRRAGLAVDGIFGPHTLSVALYGTDYA